MTSLEHYALRIRPTLDNFLRNPSKATLEAFENEVKYFDWRNLRLFDAQLLIPLVLKLDELNGINQELQCGTINCIKYITSKQYMNDIKGLRTMLIIILKQIRIFDNASTKSNLSEEIKLAAVECINETICRSTGEVLESFYTSESSSLIGHILLTLVEFIEFERYKKLRLAAINCLMTIFYVHDNADLMDVVLRSQVADTTFIYLPKVITVLSNLSISDETTGDVLKSTSIKALGRVLCLMYEETRGDFLKTHYSAKEFERLLENALENAKINFNDRDNEILGINKGKQQLQERMEQMQKDGRTAEWFGASSRKFRIIFKKLSILISHQSDIIRKTFAEMCCNLLEHCGNNMRENFLSLLENVVAMSEDEDVKISHLCKLTLQKIQNKSTDAALFDENSELLFEKHLAKLPRIIMRCQEDEQYAELLFLKGFFEHISNQKLKLIFSYPKNTNKFVECLLEAIDLSLSREFLIEEYALHQVEQNLMEFDDFSKLPWRQFRNLTSKRCIVILRSICGIIGSKRVVSQIFFNQLNDLLNKQHPAMNEIILIMLWIATEGTMDNKIRRMSFVDSLLTALFEERHWNLALEADTNYRLKPDKPSSWYFDRTPGLYESAIEIRTQNCDSDDDSEYEKINSHISLNDVQFNVLHTCIVLDAIGHCASFMGDTFDNYVFKCLHKVLTKIASSNAMIHKAAYFALLSIQKALKYSKTSQIIEANVDYITFHLNMLLKRSPESGDAVDILTSVLQLSTQKSLPHLNNIFQTIQEECSKRNQSSNVNSYLKVYLAFLKNIGRWIKECQNDLDHATQINRFHKEDLALVWIQTMDTSNLIEGVLPQNIEDENISFENSERGNNEKSKELIDDKDEDIPQHVESIVKVLNQVLKFVSSTEKTSQILSLECLIVGVPLLKDYENQLLPLVHSIWTPLVEKFKQRDSLVLNRCFSLLHELAKYAKEFILKRSLENVLPFLKQFLVETVQHNESQRSKVETQTYKLQKILLKDFGNFAERLQIEGKHLNEILDVSALYLSRNQPKELQDLTVRAFTQIFFHNGPLTYAILMKKAHLNDFKENVEKLLTFIGIN